VEAQQLSPRDWREFRRIRLTALAGAPREFSSTLADSARLSEEDWRERLAGRAQFVVRQDGQPVGTAGCLIEPDGTAELVSMWVNPDWRGRGAGDVLVSAVLGWARRAGYPDVRLWVTIGNGAAQRLYARHGFCPTGAIQPLRPDKPDQLEQEMVRTFVTVRAGGPEDLDGAAQVWAEATAARDGHGEVAPVSDSRPILLRALGAPGAEFAVAVDGGRVVAFATAARAEGGGLAEGERLAEGDRLAAGGRFAEVSYVGTAPDRWGEGLAGMVLRALARQLAGAGYDAAQLLVYADNAGARRLYERLGWVADAAPPVPHPRTGRPEQRYLLPSLD
jgi:ribosomal protein S18 acetylase RimI-like enzyme